MPSGIVGRDDGRIDRRDPREALFGRDVRVGGLIAAQIPVLEHLQAIEAFDRPFAAHHARFALVELGVRHAAGRRRSRRHRARRPAVRAAELPATRRSVSGSRSSVSFIPATVRSGRYRAPKGGVREVARTLRECVPRNLIEVAAPAERAFLLAVDTGDDPGWNAEESLAELASLAITAGADVVGAEWQNRRHVDPTLVRRQGQGRGAARRRSARPASTCSSPTTSSRPASRSRSRACSTSR